MSRFQPFWLLAGLLAVSACQPLSLPATAPASAPPTAAGPTITPTYPPPMCTPPPCWSGETYFCAGDCPNGCGTTCATRTPDPNAGPAPTFPAPETVCALPDLAPAVGTPAPSVQRCASAEAGRVGETLTIRVRATSLAEPIFSVQGQDADGFGYLGFRAKAEDQLQNQSDGSAVVQITRVRVSGSELLLTLTGRAAGQVTLTIAAGPLAGPFVSAEPLTLTLTAP